MPSAPGFDRSESVLESYSAIVGILGDGVAVLDASGVVRSLNPAGERALGAPAKAVVGQRLLDVPWTTVNEDGSERSREDHPALIALRTGEQQLDVRVGLRRRDGSMAWIDVNAVPLRVDSDEKPIGVAVSFRDVSRRRAAEVALEESEQRLDLVFNATTDSISLHAVEYPENGPPRFIFEALNAAYARMLGGSPPEIIGRPIEDVFEPQVLERVRAAFERALTEDIVRERDVIDTPAGTIHVDFVVRVVDRVNDRASRLLAVGRDITRLVSSQEELRTSEERMRTIAQSVTDAIVVTDANDRVLYVNDAIIAMTGYERDELIQRNLAELILTPEAMLDRPRRAAERAAGISERYVVEIVRKDNEHRWVEIAAAPYRDGRGNIIGTVGVLSDVTERRSLEQLREQVIGVVSHELRTPLGALSGALKLMKQNLGALEPRPKHLLDIATRNADRLLRLVNDLLDLERLGGVEALEIRSIDVDALLNGAMELMTPLAEERGIRLTKDVRGPRANGDPERLLQVIINLVGNAVKFSPDGGEVIVGSIERSDGVEIFVRDQGRGIPPDRLPILFQRFAQVHSDDARKHKGAGLGLAISRAIVEQHGGRIWAESPPEGGAVFRFTLPAVKR